MHIKKILAIIISISMIYSPSSLGFNLVPTLSIAEQSQIFNQASFTDPVMHQTYECIQSGDDAEAAVVTDRFGEQFRASYTNIENHLKKIHDHKKGAEEAYYKIKWEMVDGSGKVKRNGAYYRSGAMDEKTILAWVQAMDLAYEIYRKAEDAMWKMYAVYNKLPRHWCQDKIKPEVNVAADYFAFSPQHPTNSTSQTTYVEASPQLVNIDKNFEITFKQHAPKSGTWTQEELDQIVQAKSAIANSAEETAALAKQQIAGLAKLLRPFGRFLRKGCRSGECPEPHDSIADVIALNETATVFNKAVSDVGFSLEKNISHTLLTEMLEEVGKVSPIEEYLEGVSLGWWKHDKYVDQAAAELESLQGKQDPLTLENPFQPLLGLNKDKTLAYNLATSKKSTGSYAGDLMAGIIKKSKERMKPISSRLPIEKIANSRLGKLAASASSKLDLVDKYLGPVGTGISVFNEGASTIVNLQKGDYEAAAFDGIDTVINAANLSAQIKKGATALKMTRLAGSSLLGFGSKMSGAMASFAYLELVKASVASLRSGFHVMRMNKRSGNMNAVNGMPGLYYPSSKLIHATQDIATAMEMMRLNAMQDEAHIHASAARKMIRAQFYTLASLTHRNWASAFCQREVGRIQAEGYVCAYRPDTRRIHVERTSGSTVAAPSKQPSKTRNPAAQAPIETVSSTTSIDDISIPGFTDSGNDENNTPTGNGALRQFR